ncbi:winged helix-turn-helix transcriptional regulator [Georgenia deserti]|uniref:Winged helix-turn-helix transcriptional regulator n=1 Tax=Georgenia deserti TaxID=2093781 RepID=A0ABW4L550_9MICO
MTIAQSLHTIDDERCRLATATLEHIGKRWTGGILLALGRGATRFREILHLVDGLSDRMLSVRLRELERDGLVTRAVEPTIPVSVRYGLTTRGKGLLAAMAPLVAYSERYATD